MEPGRIRRLAAATLVLLCAAAPAASERARAFDTAPTPPALSKPETESLPAADDPSRFSTLKCFQPIDWNIGRFDNTHGTVPVQQPGAFDTSLDGAPAKTVTRVAAGTANLPSSDYTLTLIADDVARVWMDGEVVSDAWTPHESRVDRAQISGGKRRFKVEYYDAGGFAEVRFDIQRR